MIQLSIFSTLLVPLLFLASSAHSSEVSPVIQNIKNTINSKNPSFHLKANSINVAISANVYQPSCSNGIWNLYYQSFSLSVTVVSGTTSSTNPPLTANGANQISINSFWFFNGQPANSLQVTNPQNVGSSTAKNNLWTFTLADNQAGIGAGFTFTPSVPCTSNSPLPTISTSFTSTQSVTTPGGSNGVPAGVTAIPTVTNNLQAANVYIPPTTQIPTTPIPTTKTPTTPIPSTHTPTTSIPTTVTVTPTTILATTTTSNPSTAQPTTVIPTTIFIQPTTIQTNPPAPSTNNVIPTIIVNPTTSTASSASPTSNDPTVGPSLNPTTILATTTVVPSNAPTTTIAPTITDNNGNNNNNDNGGGLDSTSALIIGIAVGAGVVFIAIFTLVYCRVKFIKENQRRMLNRSRLAQV